MSSIKYNELMARLIKLCDIIVYFIIFSVVSVFNNTKPYKTGFIDVIIHHICLYYTCLLLIPTQSGHIDVY